MEQSYKTPEQIQEDLKHISPLALPEYLANCEYYDKSDAFEVLDKAVKEFENQGGLANTLFDSVWQSVVNSVGLCLLRKVHEPTYRKIVKGKCTDFSQYAKRAFTFTYDEIPAMPLTALSNLQQDYLRRNMNRQPGEKNDEGEFTPQLDTNHYDKGKDYRDKTNRDHKDQNGKTIQYNERFLEEEAAKSPDGKIRAVDGTPLSIHKEEEPDRSRRAEADHIIPLQTIHNNEKFFIERYVDLDKKDEHGRTVLQQIVNSNENFQVLPGNKNASKGGGQTNLQFIETCEKVERASEIYKKMETASPAEQTKLKEELAQLNLSANRRRDARKMANQENLTEEEKKALEKYHLSEEEKQQLRENHEKATKALQKMFLKEGSKTVLLEQIGKFIEISIGPIGFEIRDSIKNGISHGFEGCNFFEAFVKRIWRALCYTVIKLGDILVSLFGDLSKMIITFFVNACKIIQNFFGKFFDLALSGISVLVDSVKVLLGKGSAAEKGDAILKIIVGFTSGILGQFVIDSLLESLGIPDPFSEIIAAVCSAVIGSLVMGIYDRIDLFNLKRELRRQRIEEIFALRKQKLQEASLQFDIIVSEKLKQQRIAMEKIRQTLNDSFKAKDFETLNSALDDACALFCVEVPYKNTMEFMDYLRKNPQIVIC